MRRILLLLFLFPLLFGNSTAVVYAQAYEMHGETDQSNTIEPFIRGGYRSPSRSYNPGVGNPARSSPGRSDNVGNPANPRTTPSTRTGFGGFLGGMFGGLALGTILGSIFNPFAGFSLGSPLLSLLSFALWIVIILVVVRIIRRSKSKGY
jgi:hypothetical protein